MTTCSSYAPHRRKRGKEGTNLEYSLEGLPKRALSKPRKMIRTPPQKIRITKCQLHPLLLILRQIHLRREMGVGMEWRAKDAVLGAQDVGHNLDVEGPVIGIVKHKNCMDRDFGEINGLEGENT
jgi:hypothetical protein